MIATVLVIFTLLSISRYVIINYNKGSQLLISVKQDMVELGYTSKEANDMVNLNNYKTIVRDSANKLNKELLLEQDIAKNIIGINIEYDKSKSLIFNIKNIKNSNDKNKLELEQDINLYLAFFLHIKKDWKLKDDITLRDKLDELSNEYIIILNNKLNEILKYDLNKKLDNYKNESLIKKYDLMDGDLVALVKAKQEEDKKLLEIQQQPPVVENAPIVYDYTPPTVVTEVYVPQVVNKPPNPSGRYPNLGAASSAGQNYCSQVSNCSYEVYEIAAGGEAVLNVFY